MSASLARGAARLPTLSNRTARIVTFSLIYLYQGVVAGFSLTALANHDAGLGIPAHEVGLHFAVAGLPWTLQPILWGPLIDRGGGARMGRRRVFAVLAVLGAQASLCGLWLVPGPTALTGIGGVFFLHSLFASLLDTACDRLIMDHVPEAELGRMSGFTRGGFITGTSLGAGVFSWTLSACPFPVSVGLLIGLGSLALVPALLVREAAGDALLSLSFRSEHGARRPLPFRRFLRRLVLGLRRPAALRLLALCFGLDCAQSLFEVRFNVEAVQAHGWDAAALSRFQAVLVLCGGTLGAFCVGLWSDRAGPLRALTGLLGAGAGVFALAAALIAAGLVGTTAPAILGLANLLPNLLVVALVPTLMRTSRGRAGAATQFEVYMAAMNLGSVVGGGLSGLSIPLVSSSGTALLVCCIFLAAMALCRRGNLLPAADVRSERAA